MRVGADGWGLMWSSRSATCFFASVISTLFTKLLIISSESVSIFPPAHSGGSVVHGRHTVIVSLLAFRAVELRDCFSVYQDE